MRAGTRQSAKRPSRTGIRSLGQAGPDGSAGAMRMLVSAQAPMSSHIQPVSTLPLAKALTELRTRTDRRAHIASPSLNAVIAGTSYRSGLRRLNAKDCWPSFPGRFLGPDFFAGPLESLNLNAASLV